ncbi:MAG: ATP phosphoribosyltransferase regulatory subunit [Arenicella sp.]|jgi:ATP phosphoribosyltransferase regulatory subunit
MVNDANWLLPEGVEEILPDEAIKLEMLRRDVLDDLIARGFQLVMPPVMEFVDSLLTGTGEELDTQTYKFMDQHTHRMLGIRADITPQIARIDSHYLADIDINKLCYAGTVLRTQPSQMGGQRELLQIGAEIFGIAEESADIEVIEAMLTALRLSNAKQITLSLGHVGIYRALLKQQGIHGVLEHTLRDVLLRKSTPDLMDLASKLDIHPFIKLLSLAGSAGVVDSARTAFSGSPEIEASLAQLTLVMSHLSSFTDINIHIDLADVLGYRYHTGLTFNAFVADRGRTVAQGGRYDRIGEQFGRARPATGFSADLKTLVKLG